MTTTGPSPAMQTVAHHVLEVFGGEPQVTRCRQDAGDTGGAWIDVLRCDDRPQPGFTAWATVGMHRFDSGYTTADDRPLRVELVGMTEKPGDGTDCEFDAVLASCAFNLAGGEYAIAPDTIFPGLVERHRPGVSTAHVLLAPVFGWEGLESIELDGAVVTWLQAVPVTPAEFDHARAHGVEDLKTRLEEADADVADLDRASVV